MVFGLPGQFERREMTNGIQEVMFPRQRLQGLSMDGCTFDGHTIHEMKWGIGMARLMASFISLVVISLMFASASRAEINLETAVGIWLFDEGSGDVAKDVSGNGNDGKLNGGIKWVDGKFGKALEFNGKDTCVETGEQLLEKVEEFTIVLWVNKGKLTANRIGLVGQNDTVEMGFIEPTVVQVWSEGAGQGVNVNYNFPEGEWHHVAATGTTTSIKNYLDGELGNEGTTNVPDHGSSAFNVNIGGCGIFDGSGNWFSGVIDEVAIFNVALEDDDIKTIMNDGLLQTLGMTAVSSQGKLATCWGGLKAEIVAETIEQ